MERAFRTWPHDIDLNSASKAKARRPLDLFDAHEMQRPVCKLNTSLGLEILRVIF